MRWPCSERPRKEQVGNAPAKGQLAMTRIGLHEQNLSDYSGALKFENGLNIVKMLRNSILRSLGLSSRRELFELWGVSSRSLFPLPYGHYPSRNNGTGTRTSTMWTGRWLQGCVSRWSSLANRCCICGIVFSADWYFVMSWPTVDRLLKLNCKRRLYAKRQPQVLKLPRFKDSTVKNNLAHMEPIYRELYFKI